MGGRILTLVVLVCAACTVGAAGEQEKPAEGAICVRYRTETRYRNYGYDHIVHVTNGCQKPASCTVSTDVAPAAIAVTLDPGDRKEVVTFRGSPSRTFTARVICREESR